MRCSGFWTDRRLSGVGMAVLLIFGNGSRAFAAEEERIRECLIQPSANVEVGGPAEGLLDEVLVERGDDIVKGQPLARLISDLEAVTLKIAEVRAGSDASIQSGRSRVSFYRAQGQRSAKLASSNLVSREDLERSRTEEALAVAELKTAELQHELAQLEMERAQVQLEQRTIRSPIDGYVSQRHMHPGEYVNEQTPLFTLVNTERLHVEAFLPTERFHDIEVGDVLMVETLAPFAGRHQAEISTIDRVFDAASGTFGIRLVLENPEQRLPAGIRCSLLLPSQAST